MATQEQTVVIGAGPAGVAAATQLERAGMHPLLVEKGPVGGLVLNAWKVENYPGFPSGIRGVDLARLLEEQIERFLIRVERSTVVSVSRTRGGYAIESDRGRIPAKGVVVATGTVPRPLPANLAADCPPGRLFYEVKDLPADRRRRVAIVGGGDAAFDYALGLADGGTSVDVFFRSPRPRALRLLVAQAQRSPRIRIHAGTEVKNIAGTHGGIQLRFSDGSACEADVLLAAIGRDPNVSFLADEIRQSIEENGTGGLPGFHLAGDVRRGLHRQVAVAVGDGLVSAMQITALFSGGTDE